MKKKFFFGLFLMACILFSVASAEDMTCEEIDLTSELREENLTTLLTSTATDRFYVLDANENKIISIASDGEIGSVPSISLPEDGQYLSTIALTSDGEDAYVIAETLEEDEDHVELTDAGLYHLDPVRGIGELVCPLDSCAH